MGIEFIKGKVARITEDVNQTPVVRVELIDENSKVVERKHDIVVLSVGMLPGWNPESVLEYRQPRTDSFISPIRYCPHSNGAGWNLCNWYGNRSDGHCRQYCNSECSGRRSRGIYTIAQWLRGGCD